MSGSSLDVWVRNILLMSGSLPEDIRVHPKRVSSAIGSQGFPILGVFSVLILAYSLVPRIQWTGSSLFNSTSSISTPLRWSYFARVRVRVNNTPRSLLLSLCAGENFPRGFQSPRLDFDFRHELISIVENLAKGEVPKLFSYKSDGCFENY